MNIEGTVARYRGEAGSHALTIEIKVFNQVGFDTALVITPDSIVKIDGEEVDSSGLSVIQMLREATAPIKVVAALSSHQYDVASVAEFVRMP